MRRFAGVVALLVVPLSALASGAVEVISPRVTVLSFQRVQEECRTAKRVNACMHIEAMLMTSCTAVDGIARMSAGVRLTPNVFTISLTMLPHEMGHLADFVHLLREHNRKLIEPAFDSIQACAATARVAEMTFGQKLRSYQQTSAHRRDRREASKVAAGRPGPTPADLGD
ncbi:MAG TPA: hypothetical protein VMS98_13895 [Thermoanaerobaculia bacterium]|nr:hypothetical protein [Thermoanaerobaculia bacterium]